MWKKFDDEFYIRLLRNPYLGAGFYWGSDTYQEYYWWVEDSYLGRKGLLTLEELVENILITLSTSEEDKFIREFPLPN